MIEGIGSEQSFVFEGESGVDGTVSSAGVDQSLEGMVRDRIRDERDYEGVDVLGKTAV